MSTARSNLRLLNSFTKLRASRNRVPYLRSFHSFLPAPPCPQTMTSSNSGWNSMRFLVWDSASQLIRGPGDRCAGRLPTMGGGEDDVLPWR